ncbi:MAG: gluP [Mucilaginibacter sp.]|nr:gluP [Mucilaginibacter sp.]
MAFGFSPKYIEEFPLDDLTSEQFLVLAIQSAQQLGWDVGYKGADGFVAYTPFSMSSWTEEVKVTISGNAAVLKSECTGTQMVDWGKNKRNIENLVSTIDELKATVTPEELVQKYNELKPTLASDDAGGLTGAPATTKEKLSGFLAIFLPTNGYYITPILINLNIAVFILMVLSGVDFLAPDTRSLVNWGANFRPMTLQGEWWRLITNCFLHIGILHLLMNMYALLYIGLLLEPYLGKARFLAAYLLTGIAASTCSLWYHDLTVSAGASGAIFGMYGVFLAMLTTNLIEKSARKNLLLSISVFVAYNLMNGMKAGIDNAAHLGGLIAGFVTGYAYYPGLRSPQAANLKLGSIGSTAFVILVSCCFVFKSIPNNNVNNDAETKPAVGVENKAFSEYDAKIKSFIAMERMALEVYRLPKTTPKDTLLYEIKDRGIYYWNMNIELLHEIDKLQVPDAVHKRDKMLLNYCDLRLRSYNLIYKAVYEETDKYKDSIDMYDKHIKAVIDSLKGK